MKYLLDTCVVSEFVATSPEKRVLDWLERVDEHSLWLSVLTIGELSKGIEKLPHSKKRATLALWLNHDLPRRFEGRIAVLDTETLLLWGMLCARLEKLGSPMPAIDSLIAASVLHLDCTLVTRNTHDFRNAGAQLFNPWI
jgi:tRNA(fMet)-specific endonuclease VapC